MLQEQVVSDMLKFWMELFDKKIKSEAAKRSQSKFKLSLMIWKKHPHPHPKKKKKKMEIKELL